MNKQEQQEFFIKEIQPYVDLKVKEVFDDIDSLLDKWRAYVSIRVFTAIEELKTKHLTPISKGGKE